MKQQLRELAKTAAVKSGSLDLYHRLKHREQLTVLMFHRVLPDQAVDDADTEYTISTSLLKELIEFTAKHYNFVALDEVLGARRGEKVLPPCPLLLTFDDGWADNAVHAAPVLAKAKAPWVLFAATDAIASGDQWWQEVVLWTLRTGRASHQDLRALVPSQSLANVDPANNPDLSILVLYGTLPAAKRDELLNRHPDIFSMPATPRHMAHWETLRALQHAGVGIGGHGASHLPLTMLTDPAEDLRRARSTLRHELGESACTTLSFPHGRYNQKIADTARELGNQLMFTSDPILNDCSDGRLTSDLIGRIPISTGAIAHEKGRLDLNRVMPWLMLRQ